MSVFVQKSQFHQILHQWFTCEEMLTREATPNLNCSFPDDRVIGRGFLRRWPARSPDLSPLDFWFWGTLKGRIFHHGRPANMNELIARITEECANVSSEELQNAVSHLLLRLYLVVENEGGLIEPLM